MKLKYILMCVLAIIGIAMQAQNNVRYEICSTPATEVVEGHIYVLRNRANQEEVLTYSNNIAFTTGWGSITFGNCMDYQSYFITAGADGFTLPITLDNVNRYFGPNYAGTGYGEGEGTALTLSATSTKMGFDKGVIDDISGLQLWGTFEPMDVTSGYYLDAKDGKLYSIEEYCISYGRPLTIPAYRAWFDGNVSPSGAPLRINIDDEATAIAAISALTEGKAEIYDMNGRRIQSLQNGVNIVKYGNGKTKKVIIK